MLLFILSVGDIFALQYSIDLRFLSEKRISNLAKDWTMSIKTSAFFTCLVALYGCENQPEPFDVSQIDCQKPEVVESIPNEEHRAKAVAHCASLKLRESRYKPSEDKAWSL